MSRKKKKKNVQQYFGGIIKVEIVTFCCLHQSLNEKKKKLRKKKPTSRYGKPFRNANCLKAKQTSSSAVLNIQMAELKLCVFGGGAVGKSAITINFVHKHFIELYDPTIEDNYRRTWIVDGEMYLLDVLDTAGQEDFTVLRDSYMRTSEAFILVYDITNADSFTEVQKIYSHLCMARDSSNIPLLVIGNKVDLAAQRKVSSFEGQQWAKSIGAAFLESSAKQRINIDESFTAIVREIRAHKERLLVSHGKKKAKKASKCPLV